MKELHDMGRPKEEQTEQKINASLQGELSCKITYDRPGGFWVETITLVEELMGYLRKAVGIAESAGFEARECVVDGGVHERDTGYEDFSRRYSSFAELDTRLISDYKNEEATLDGLWFNTLNFAYIEVQLVKAEKSIKMNFCRGVLKIYGDLNQTKELAKKLEKEMKPEAEREIEQEQNAEVERKLTQTAQTGISAKSILRILFLIFCLVFIMVDIWKLLMQDATLRQTC